MFTRHPVTIHACRIVAIVSIVGVTCSAAVAADWCVDATRFFGWPRLPERPNSTGRARQV